MNKRNDARCITRKLLELRRAARELVVLKIDYFRRCLEPEDRRRACGQCPDGGGLRLRRVAEKLWSKRRNIREAPFVYTGADRYTAALGEIQKNPRGGSRGAMTRSLSGR